MDRATRLERDCLRMVRFGALRHRRRQKAGDEVALEFTLNDVGGDDVVAAFAQHLGDRAIASHRFPDALRLTRQPLDTQQRIDGDVWRLVEVVTPVDVGVGAGLARGVIKHRHPRFARG